MWTLKTITEQLAQANSKNPKKLNLHFNATATPYSKHDASLRGN